MFLIYRSYLVVSSMHECLLGWTTNFDLFRKVN